jgi:aspartyl-tRNA(Asn)/glutamyl-tRNA(Gln) amidotransferase subunit A
LATDVPDVATLLGVIAGHDQRDSTSVDAPVPDYVRGLDRPWKGLRVGVCEEHFGAGLDGQVQEAVRSAVALMAAEGAQVVSVDLPHMKHGVACYYIIAPAEACSNLARFDGIHYGYRAAETSEIYELYARSRGRGFGAEVKRRIMLGTYALSSGYYDAYYLKALKVRTLMKQDFDRAFEKVDVIASPVAPTTAFPIGEKADDPLAMYLSDVYTISANLAGVCAISIPCGFDRAGLPIGLQLTARAFGEETLLAAAHQYQLRTDFHRCRPPIAAAA